MSGDAELVHALTLTVDRHAMLRAHVKAALSTAMVRQSGSQDPDQWVEVVGLLTMALQEDDRPARCSDEIYPGVNEEG